MIPRRRRAVRGSTLLELMIAMAVLTIGLLAMWRMHMIGLGSTAAGRRHSTAMAMAQELGQGLERLAYPDALLSETGGTGPTQPATFGRLVTGLGMDTVLPGAHVWSDATPVPGVRLDSQMREMADAAGAFQRRWSVWGYAPVGGGRSGVKLIAVSVTWRDPPFSSLREVVVYTQLNDQSTFAATLGANQ